MHQAKFKPRRALNMLFHACRAEIRDRRENQAEKGEAPIVNKKHHGIAEQGYARIKYFRREFAHSFYAVVNVRNSFYKKRDPVHGRPQSPAFLFLLQKSNKKDR